MSFELWLRILIGVLPIEVRCPYKSGFLWSPLSASTVLSLLDVELTVEGGLYHASSVVTSALFTVV